MSAFSLFMSYPPPPLSQQPRQTSPITAVLFKTLPPASLYVAPPPSATSADLLNQVLQHVGVPLAHLESANLKIGYKLLCPCGEGVTADFVALQEFPIEGFFVGSRPMTLAQGYFMFPCSPKILSFLIKPSRPCSGLLLHRMSTRNGPTHPLQGNSSVFLFMRTQTIVLIWSFQTLQQGAS